MPPKEIAGKKPSRGQSFKKAKRIPDANKMISRPQESFSSKLSTPTTVTQSKHVPSIQIDDVEALLNSTDVGIPPGLELLVAVTKVSFGPAIPIQPLEQYKFSRNYSIRDQSGQEIFFGGEKVNAVSELLCQGFRPFRIDIFDFVGELVMKFEQTCSCMLGLFNAECGGAKVDVELTDGEIIGSVKQSFGCCTPEYEILDENGERLMNIVGEFGRVCFLCKAQSFHVYADIQRDDDVISENVANIGRRYINFKEDMSVEMKCLVISAMFLLEMDYYRSCRGLRKMVIIIVLIVAGVLAYRFSPHFKSANVPF
ncbi:unnamed protein product [Allacma fusca]|uniref:Phospholipid scramblase n=1 Tax=Allacma fusca TaxID=39272 RepID=A0A8J2LJ64_9HEXA|nr:unnamed protein product [Allacma fusca]